jgi:GT2 family glycosyltransferase
MITIIYSTHKDKEYNNKFRHHLLQNVGLKDVEILEFENFNQYSLAEVYNKGIYQSKYDIVCCVHNDIKLSKNWGKELLNDFNKNSEFGIIGKAGTSYYPESGVYWERMNQTMVGHVAHQPENSKKWVNKYSNSFNEIIPVISIDGLFISFDKNKIKYTFDESIGRFHFYDHTFCLKNYIEGVKIGVTFSFDVIHESIGRPNEEFFESKNKFVEKFSSYLPLDLKPNSFYVPKITGKPIKNIGKVAVIIPTKNKSNLVIDCVNSFFEHCDPNTFHIFIADTGSDDDEKLIIKSLSDSHENVSVIEYDYYNFAKTNNDIVKNHIGSEFEFLLFCNNDIKLMNNVIYGMLKVFKTYKNTGTVGCRLHFEDNTIQHDGVRFMVDQHQMLHLSHYNFRSYYTYTKSLKEVPASTAALLMITKNVFNKCGGFNENYTECFEDVELNLKALLLGLTNYYDGSLVAYHYESQTRNDDELKNEKARHDFKEHLFPFINSNLNKFGKFFDKITLPT